MSTPIISVAVTIGCEHCDQRGFVRHEAVRIGCVPCLGRGWREHRITLAELAVALEQLNASSDTKANEEKKCPTTTVF